MSLQALQRFAVQELSNFYLDIAKDRLYVLELALTREGNPWTLVHSKLSFIAYYSRVYIFSLTCHLLKHCFCFAGLARLSWQLLPRACWQPWLQSCHILQKMLGNLCPQLTLLPTLLFFLRAGQQLTQPGSHCQRRMWPQLWP